MGGKEDRAREQIMQAAEKGYESREKENLRSSKDKKFKGHSSYKE